jgi:hypothetical protein
MQKKPPTTLDLLGQGQISRLASVNPGIMISEVIKMQMAPTYSLPKLDKLPDTMAGDGAISLSLQEGAPVFRASSRTLRRIRELLDKEKSRELTAVEKEELDRYEAVDDYLSHLNRLARNLLIG